MLTDIELGVLFQVIEKSGKIPWDSITLLEGRTRKACEVMIDKDKETVKAASGNEEGAGEETEKVKTEADDAGADAFLEIPNPGIRLEAKRCKRWS